MPRAPHTRDWISLLALTALWGSAFLLNEIVLAALPPSVLVAGTLFLDESLSPSVFVGLVLILYGIALSEIGPRVFRALQALRTRYLPSSMPLVAQEDA